MAIGLAVAYSEFHGSEWTPGPDSQPQKVIRRLMKRESDGLMPTLEPRAPKKKPKASQAGPSGSGSQGVSQSPSASQGSSKSTRGRIGSPGSSAGSSSMGSPTLPSPPDPASGVTSNLAALRLSSHAEASTSHSQAQSNIGRDRSPEQDRNQAHRPEAEWNLGPQGRRITFDEWLANGREQIRVAEAKAVEKPGGGRQAQRAARKELQKAATAKAEHKDLRKEMKTQLAKTLPAMANTRLPTPNPWHPTHRLVHTTAETGVRLAAAGMNYDQAERNVADTLRLKGHWSEVPPHLKKSFRTTAKTKVAFAHAEAFSHKWNTFVGEEEAKSQTPGSELRQKTDKEVDLSQKLYASKARLYKKYVAQNREVRATFSGSDSSDTDRSDFNDALSGGE